jgi:hypothetical protein
VTVLDNQLPAIACPADVTVTNDPGTNVATIVTLGVPATSDNCGVLTVSSNAPAQFTVGTNLVTWTVVDIHDNTNTCQQRVVVEIVSSPAVPTLGLEVQGGNLLLSWPANHTGYVLEYSTHLPATGWISNSTIPAIVGGQYVITNPVSSEGIFFRLTK